jgi:uncharacterized SAM-binding protein YcdF (DUF218 family)
VDVPTERTRLARAAVTGAILGALCAVSAQVLGVQQLLRRPDLALYVPAALVGAAIGATRLRPILWIGAGILAAFCIVVGYTPVVGWLARPLIRRDPLTSRVDAVAVLSMGLTPDGMMRGETLDRFLSGLSLARSGIAPALLVSRERRVFGTSAVSDSADLQTIAAIAGPGISITFVDSVYTTRTEALRMKTIAQRNGWTTLAVVTSPMHTRRACATFEAVGLRVVCVPAAVRDAGLAPESNAEQRLHSFDSWLYEAFATDTYRRRGWIR